MVWFEYFCMCMKSEDSGKIAKNIAMKPRENTAVQPYSLQNYSCLWLAFQHLNKTVEYI